MKKFLTSLVLTSALLVQACWFTTENFNGNYIAGANNFVEHYTPVESINSAVYHNGGSVSLPLTVYVRITESKSTQQGQTVSGQVQIAILQYKVKHNNTWGKWKTVKKYSNTSWSLYNTKPTAFFGKENINPKGLVSGDEIMVRLYLSDGVYETGDLDVDPGEVGNSDTVSTGTYNGGWTAPYVFKVIFDGKYWR